MEKRMPKRVSFHHQFVISLSLLFVSEEVFKNVSPFSCTFVPCMYNKSFNLCSIIVWNDCLQKEFFNLSMKAGCFFFGHVMILWSQKKFIIALRNGFKKKEVMRARILVPHSNKNQFKPIYSVCSQLLKQMFAESSS